MSETFTDPKDCLKSTDLQSISERSRQHYFQITKQQDHLQEYFCCPDGEKIKVDKTSVAHVPLYRDDDSLKLLLLVNPNKRDSVVAVYLNERWQGVNDVFQCSGPMQDGLGQVQTCRERIILFVLNCLVCGFLEGDGSENGVCFLPHAAEELAKILWHKGEAVAFYTYKSKGSLCDRSSQCYMLPVLDTIYVRKQWRKHGFAIAMLQDFCKTFSQELALGISLPISLGMYHVCHRFLLDNPKEQDRLWEVEPPGDWGQRMNIWLRIQLGETPVKVEHLPEPLESRELEIPMVKEQSKQLNNEEKSISPIDKALPLCSKMMNQNRKKWRKGGVKKRLKKQLHKIKTADTQEP
ncbi:protein FAM169B-like [Gastrophryne carolinensis]